MHMLAIPIPIPTTILPASSTYIFITVIIHAISFLNCSLTYLFGDTAMTTEPTVKTTDATRIAGFLPNLPESR